MSKSFQIALKEMGDQILGITSTERKALEEKPHLLCTFAEKEIRENAGPVNDPMELFERLGPEQKRQFARKVVEQVLIYLGLRRKKKKELEEENEQQLTI
jgi:hypothetical protein